MTTDDADWTDDSLKAVCERAAKKARGEDPGPIVMFAEVDGKMQRVDSGAEVNAARPKRKGGTSAQKSNARDGSPRHHAIAQRHARTSNVVVRHPKATAEVNAMIENDDPVIEVHASCGAVFHHRPSEMNTWQLRSLLKQNPVTDGDDPEFLRRIEAMRQELDRREPMRERTEPSKHNGASRLPKPPIPS